MLGEKSIYYVLDLPESLDRACTAIVATVWHMINRKRSCWQESRGRTIALATGSFFTHTKSLGVVPEDMRVRL